MPLPFNRELDLKLLQMVKENEVLYNIKSKHYQDIDSREVIWQRIGDALGRPASACRTRWVNIRDMFRKKLRKRITQPEEPQSQYKYEQAMSFIIPFFKDFSNESQEISALDYLDQDTDADDGKFQQSYISHSPEVEDKLSTPVTTVQIVEDRKTLNPSDPLDVFLLTIGATLRKFSPYYLNQAKSKIFQVVQDYELKQIDGPSNSDYL